MEQVKSEKVFFNVFPTLKVGDELQMLFSDVEVKKITTNSGRDFLHIHILCRHLIQKKQIWLMEQRTVIWKSRSKDRNRGRVSTVGALYATGDSDGVQGKSDRRAAADQCTCCKYVCKGRSPV